jgi:hypothetical protein
MSSQTNTFEVAKVIKQDDPLKLMSPLTYWPPAFYIFRYHSTGQIRLINIVPDVIAK